jgi:hypothetical protein
MWSRERGTPTVRDDARPVAFSEHRTAGGIDGSDAAVRADKDIEGEEGVGLGVCSN